MANIIKSKKNSISYPLSMDIILPPKLSKLAVCVSIITEGTVKKPLKYITSSKISAVKNISITKRYITRPLPLNNNEKLKNINVNAK